MIISDPFSSFFRFSCLNMTVRAKRLHCKISRCIMEIKDSNLLLYSFYRTEGAFMIELMAKKLCCFVSNNINEDETDTVKNQIYLYGIELCISSIINIILIVCVGAVLGCFVESLIFLICFISLRQFTGGYHADTYLKCNLFFVITFVFVISLTKFTIVRLSLPWIIIRIIITTVIVALLAPIKNHHKHIGKKLQMKSKFISVLLWIIFNLCGVIFYFVNTFVLLFSRSSYG